MIRSTSGRYLIATLSAVGFILAVAEREAHAQNPTRVQCLETCDSEYNVGRNRSGANNKCSTYRAQCTNRCYR